MVSVEIGYYKHYKGGIYYVICDAIKCDINNTQLRFIIYKNIENNVIFARDIDNFTAFVETEEGERLKRFKKLDNYIPTWPPTIYQNPNVYTPSYPTVYPYSFNPNLNFPVGT